VALENVIEEMRFLAEHPRMQQRNWVAKAGQWLPVLQHAKEDLQREVRQHDFVAETLQGLLSALERVGLRIEKRDEASWGYCWHSGVLKGAYATRAEALEAALKERLK